MLSPELAATPPPASVETDAAPPPIYSYYYDDATGYEIYNPANDEEDED